MNMANPTLNRIRSAFFLGWYDPYEAAAYLSDQTNYDLDHRAVLLCALNKGLRLVVYVPTGTEDREGRPMQDGLWDLIADGKLGNPARQHLQHETNPATPLEGIRGAWVERGGVQRRLRPAGYPDRSYSAIPEGCVIGVRKTALDDLAEKLRKEFAEDGPTPSASDSAKDLDKPLGSRERNTLLKVIIGLAQLAKVKLSHPSSDAASSRIESETTDLGVRVPERTVVEKLKEADDYLRSVGKPPK